MSISSSWNKSGTMRLLVATCHLQTHHNLFKQLEVNLWTGPPRGGGGGQGGKLPRAPKLEVGAPNLSILLKLNKGIKIGPSTRHKRHRRAAFFWWPGDVRGCVGFFFGCRKNLVVGKKIMGPPEKFLPRAPRFLSAALPVDNKFWQSTCNKSACDQQAVTSQANAS